MDLAALVGAQQVAGSADFQIAHGDTKTGAKLIGFEDGVDALAGGLGDLVIVGEQQICVGPVVATSDTPAQLVKLCQTEAVRPVDDDGVDVWHIEAGFDYGGADQDVSLPVGESHHHLFQFRLRHLTVADEDARLRRQFAQLLGDVVDGPHAVVEKENLPVAFQFPQDRLTDRLSAVLGNEGFDREARFRRSMDHAHVADSGQGHVQGARDGRRAESEDVHLGPHLLEPFLVGHAETVLLVNDDQAEVLEAHVLLQDPVRADYDVHRAGFGRLHHFFLLFVGSEAAQYFDLHRVGSQPLRKGGVVLLGQNRGRHQNRHLHSLVHRLERRPQGHLGLAVTHVAADQAVHGLGHFHVVFDFLNGLNLVGGFLEGERIFQVALPRSVGAEAMPADGFANSVKAQQFFGDLSGRPFGSILDALPLAAAQAREGGRLVGGRDVCAQPVQLFGRHVEAVVLGVLQHQVFAVFPGGFQMRCADKPGHPMIDVHHIAARRQVRQRYGVAQISVGFGRAKTPLFHRTEQFGVAVHRDGGGAVAPGNLPSPAQRPGQYVHPAGAWASGQVIHQLSRYAGFVKELG